MTFNNKLNLVRAFAIIGAVMEHSGSLQIFGPIFNSHTYNIPLFMFISGYLYNEDYEKDVFKFIIKRAKRLLVPYYLYSAFYALITILIFNKTNVIFGQLPNFKNFFIAPFTYWNSYKISDPLWFVPQLFLLQTLFILLFPILKKISMNKYFHLTFFLFISYYAIYFSIHTNNLEHLLTPVRLLFLMFFYYCGFFYKKYVENNINIFSLKVLFGVICLQSLIFLIFKKPFFYMNHCYFPNSISPILTGVTGIWFTFFVAELVIPFVKNNDIITKIGKHTYAIMANHLFIIFLITQFFLSINDLNISAMNKNIYWTYKPEYTACFYAIIAIFGSLYTGIALSFVWNKIKSYTVKCTEINTIQTELKTLTDK